MKRILVLLMLCGVISLFLGTMPSAEANGALTWTTTEIRHHGDRIVMEGYFTNQSNHRTVDRINSFAVRIHAHNRYGQEVTVAHQRFGDMNVHIRPGETFSHRFVVHEISREHEYQHLRNFDARYHVNFRYHGSHEQWEHNDRYR